VSTQPSCRAGTTGKVASSFSLPRIVITTLQQQPGRIRVALPRNHPAKVPDAPRWYRAHATNHRRGGARHRLSEHRPLTLFRPPGCTPSPMPIARGVSQCVACPAFDENWARRGRPASPLVDHPGCACEQHARDGQTHSFRRLEVDHKLELGWLLDG
jgi:hypothetical protein